MGGALANFISKLAAVFQKQKQDQEEQQKKQPQVINEQDFSKANQQQSSPVQRAVDVAKSIGHDIAGVGQNIIHFGEPTPPEPQPKSPQALGIDKIGNTKLPLISRPVQTQGQMPEVSGDQYKNYTPLIDRGKEIAAAAKNVAIETPARAAGAFTLSAKGEKEYTPTDPVSKFLFGNQPVENLQEQGKQYSAIAQKFGVRPDIAQKAGLPVAVGLGISDLIPGVGGAKKEVAKEGITAAADTAKPLLGKIKQATGLSPENQKIQQDMTTYLEHNFGDAVQKYNALPDSKGGAVLNTDVARELSPAYAADRSKSVAVHEPASALIKELYQTKLKETGPHGENTVLFTGGGTGSGKTSTINALPEIKHDVQFVYDTNSAKGESAIGKIQQALDAGKKVAFAYVHRDPVEALQNGALPRAMRMGRTVPLDVHAETHVGAPKAAQQIYEKFKDNPNFKMEVIDNTKGQGNASLASIDLLKNLDYNKADLTGKLRQVTDDAYKQSKINDKVYEGFTGEKPKLSQESPQLDTGPGAQGKPESKIGAAQPGTATEQLPLISPERNAAINATDPAEVTTKLWHDEYLPKIQGLLEQAKSAPEADLPKFKQQIEALQTDFSTKTDALQNGLKERKFISSVKEDPGINEDIRSQVQGEYKPRGNQELVKTVQQKIEADPVGSLEHVLGSNQANDEQVAMGVDFLRRFNNSGDTARAVDVVERLAPKLTEAGRTVQAASILGRLSPEGALMYTQRIINKATKPGEEAQKISEGSAKEITDLAKKANTAKDGTREQEVAAAKLAKRINEEVPSSIGSKISTLQTIAQLLNPKTAIRNYLGNTAFSALENVKDVVATPIDAAAGLITGERFKTFPNPVTQAKGYVKGFKEGASDALQGIDTQAQAGKFDLAKTSVFATKSSDNIVKKAVYKPLDVLERITRLTLQAPDKASYQAAYDDSMRQMMQTRKITDPANVTDEMKAVAHADGLYRTFQDDTIASKMFSQIKQGLNVGKSFGAGDLVLKYPKTPGNLLARGIEYSPIGFFSSAINLAKMVMGKPLSQKAFVESTARAVTGTTALVATGAILHQMGIITGKPGTDSDIKALGTAQGGGDYRLNTSALLRFVSSGFDKTAATPQTGDKIMTYDWFQPQAINFAMGADIDANNGVNPKSLIGTLIGAAASASNTLVEQPLISGISRLFNYGDLPGGVAETLAGTPSSFSPTILNQVRQLIDNTTRDPQDPDLVKKALNLVENKIPGLEGKVAPKYDVLGNPVQNYQNGGNNWFNVFFNPAFSSKIESTPDGKEVMRLFESTGESSQAPHQQGNTIRINGETKQLTGAEKQQYQQYIGVKTHEYFQAAMQKEAYKKLSDEDKVKALSNILTDVAMAGKVELFGQKGSKSTPRKERVRTIMKMDDPTFPLIAR